MMHSCKFYSFLGDQSLEKWVKYIKTLIINKRFYFLTAIENRKIENFNRLPTKLLNFNRQPTSGPPHSDPLYRQTDFTPKRVDVSRLHDNVARFRTGVKFSPQ